MVRQNKVRPQTPSDFFADDGILAALPGRHGCRTAALKINGEVVVIDGKPVYPYEDAPVNTGRIPGTTNFVRSIRCPSPAQLLDRGAGTFSDQLHALPRPGRRRQGHHQQIRHGQHGEFS